jgi:subtilisin family serine protease
LVLAGTVATSPSIAASAADPAVSVGPVIVDVAPGSSPQAVANKYGIAPTQVYTEAIAGFAATVTEAQLTALTTDRAVESITEDEIVFRRDPREVARLSGRPKLAADAPPQFEQYVTPEVRRVGGPGSRTADIDGTDDRRVRAGIAVLDGGIDPNHPDLNVAGGVDCVRGPKNERGYYDRDGHGTLVAGFAAAIDNAIGTVGTAPGARLYAVRVADPNGLITDSALLCGLEWVIRHADVVDVANLSFSGTGNAIGPCTDPRRLKQDRLGKRAPVDRMHQKICRATARGVTVVAAAGNAAMDASTVTPAVYDEVITVSAFADYDGLPGAKAAIPTDCPPYNPDDHFADFSNFGQPVDISAPGVCTLSTVPGGNYGYVEGTSFAAPLVAGGAALVRAKNPTMSPARVRARLLALAIRGTVTGDPDVYPEGVLNIGPL